MNWETIGICDQCDMAVDMNFREESCPHPLKAGQVSGYLKAAKDAKREYSVDYFVGDFVRRNVEFREDGAFRLRSGEI